MPNLTLLLNPVPLDALCGSERAIRIQNKVSKEDVIKRKAKNLLKSTFILSGGVNLRNVALNPKSAIK